MSRDIMDLLVEFDEMGFVPSVPVPNNEAYAIKWREEIAEALADYRNKIFEEIEKEIEAALKSNYYVLPQIEESEALWNRVHGKIDALRGIEGFIEELREKYTEDET